MKTIYYEKNIPKILLTKLFSKMCEPLLFSGLNAVRFKRDIPDPPLPAGDWVRVRNVACGLCGTDISFFRSTASTNCAFEPVPSSEKTFLGHENIGVVTEVGSGVSRLKVGDRVTIKAYMSGCDTKGIRERCPYCERGEYNFCLNYGKESPYDVEYQGAGWSDSFIYPEGGLLRLDDKLTDDEALMLEPSAVSIHSVLVDVPKSGEKILVMGCGTIGLGVVQAIKTIAPETEVYVLERVASKRKFAMKLGADGALSGEIYDAAAKTTGGSEVYRGFGGNSWFFGGFDRVYDCIGGDWSNHTSVRLLKARGTLIKIGHHMSSVKFDETPVWWQELKLIGVDAHGVEHFEGETISTFELAERWIVEGRYCVEGFITHRFALDDYRSALKLAIKNPPEVIKIVLDCE